MSAVGDEVFAVFEQAAAGLDGALRIQRAMQDDGGPGGGEVRLRVGLHRGRRSLTETGYVGLSVHAAARICFAAHGGQIVMSAAVRSAIKDGLPRESANGPRELALPRPARPIEMFQVHGARPRRRVPPLRSPRRPEPQDVVSGCHHRLPCCALLAHRALALSSRRPRRSAAGIPTSASRPTTGPVAPLAVGDSVMLGAIDPIRRAGFEVDAAGCRLWSQGVELLRNRPAGAPTTWSSSASANWTVTTAASALRAIGPERVLGLITPRELGGDSSSDQVVIRQAAEPGPARSR